MQLTQETSTYTGQRIYLDENGGRYVSVSRLANFFQNTYGLNKWRKKVGYAEADRILKESAARGTAVHLSIETGELTGNDDYDQFVHQYSRHIQSHLEIVHQEIILGYTTSEGLRFAGTCDLVAKWRGNLIIGDWKTSDKLKNKNFMSGYALQLAAYSLSFEQSHESHTDTGVIFNLTPDSATIFSIPLELPKTFLLDELLPAFYSYYRLPEPRPWANQYNGMGNRLQQFEKELATQIEVEYNS